MNNIDKNATFEDILTFRKCDQGFYLSTTVCGTTYCKQKTWYIKGFSKMQQLCSNKSVELKPMRNNRTMLAAWHRLDK